MVARNPRARRLTSRNQPRGQAPRLADRFERAPYLEHCLQLCDELIMASGVRDFVVPADDVEPAEPTAAEQVRLAAGIAACCATIRAKRPQLEPQRHRVSAADVAAVKRVLALDGMGPVTAARIVGLDVGTVRKIAAGKAVRGVRSARAGEVERG